MFLGLGGTAKITFTTCTGCADLLSDPLLDATAQTGTFISGLFADPAIDSVLAMLGEGKRDKAKEDEKKDDEGAEAECH